MAFHRVKPEYEHCYLSGDPQADKDHAATGLGDRAWSNHTVVKKTILGKWKVVGHLCLFHGINAMKAGMSMPMQEPPDLVVADKGCWRDLVRGPPSG